MKIFAKFIQKVCSKTPITRKAYSQYADIKHLYKVSKRAGRMYAGQNKFTSIFTGINSVRKEIGYFPLITAAASGTASTIFIPMIPGPTAIGLLGGIAIKKGVKHLFKVA